MNAHTHRSGIVIASLSALLLIALVGLAGDDRPAAPSERKDTKAARARELFNHAEEHVRLTSWDRAAELYLEALGLFPEFAQARFGLAICYERKADLPKAVEQLRLVAASKATSAELALAAAARVERLLIPELPEAEERALDAARAYLQKAAQLKEDGVAATEGSAFSTATAEAIDRYKNLLRRTSDYLPLYRDLGLAYELAGMRDEAVKAFAEYLTRFGKLGIPLGQPQRDVRARKALLEIGDRQSAPDPNGSGEAARARQAVRDYETGYELEVSGSYAAAARSYQRVVATAPDHSRAQFRLGLCHRALDRPEEAIQCWNKALKGKNLSEAFIQELCELIESAAQPTLSSDHRAKLAEAIALYEAARAIHDKRYTAVSTKGDYSERQRELDVKTGDLRARATTKALASIELFRELMGGQEPTVPSLHLHAGRAHQLLSEIEGPPICSACAANSRKGYRAYLKWYATLGIPDTPRVADARARLKEVDGRSEQ